MLRDSFSTNSKNNLFLNAAIGFLSVLLITLVVALFFRFLLPRISNARSDINQELVSTVIQLEVLNGCGVPGIASTFTSALRNNGFDVVDSGNFERFDVQKSFVISRSNSTDNAKQVAAALGINEENIITEASPDYYLDVTVVIGNDFNQLKNK